MKWLGCFRHLSALLLLFSVFTFFFVLQTAESLAAMEFGGMAAQSEVVLHENNENNENIAKDRVGNGAGFERSFYDTTDVTSQAQTPQTIVYASDWSELENAVNQSNVKVMLEGKNYNASSNYYFSDLENVTISGTNGTTILGDDRYESVIHFLNCRNIVVENVVIGHSDPNGGASSDEIDEAQVGCGPDSAVIDAENSSITINGCDLFGCGWLGIRASGSNAFVSVNQTIIRDCSGYILTMWSGRMSFNGCSFLRNGYKEPSYHALILSYGFESDQLVFTDCAFENNKNPSFYGYENEEDNSNIPSPTLINCSFNGNTWDSGGSSVISNSAAASDFAGGNTAATNPANDSANESAVLFDGNTDEGYEVTVPAPDLLPESEGFVETESRGEFSEFRNLYLDGAQLVRGYGDVPGDGEDYTAREGSTRLTIRTQTLKRNGAGQHKLTMEFRKTDGTLKRASQTYTLASSSASLGTSVSGGGNGGSSSGSSTSNAASSGTASQGGGSGQGSNGSANVSSMATQSASENAGSGALAGNIAQNTGRARAYTLRPSTPGAWVSDGSSDATGPAYSYLTGDGLRWNGWIVADHYWFHLDPNGRMQTGWQVINGKTYYFNEVPDGTRGELYVGWNNINGKWYYFHERDDERMGEMYVDAIAPDGRRLGADGALLG